MVLCIFVILSSSLKHIELLTWWQMNVHQQKEPHSVILVYIIGLIYKHFKVWWLNFFNLLKNLIHLKYVLMDSNFTIRHHILF